MLKGKEPPSKDFDPVPNFKYGAWRQKPHFSSDDEEPVEVLVQGADRFKYSYSCGYSKGDSKKEDEHKKLSKIQEPFAVHVREHVPKQTISIEVQTDYRESETQTEPWDPPFNQESTPPELEVLTLAHMKYGNELPVDEEGLEEIAEARVKRDFECQVPQIFDNEEDITKFHQMIVEQKTREVNFMKLKIKRYYEKQLALKKAQLIQEIHARKDKSKKILDGLWAKKKLEVSQKVSKVEQKFFRKMRILEQERMKMIDKHKHQMDHFDLALLKSVSESNAVPDNDEEFQEQKKCDFYLDTAEGLAQLEQWLWEEQKIVMEPEIFLPKIESRQTRLQRTMEKTQRELSELKAKKRLVMVKTTRAQALDKHKGRATTPTTQPVLPEVLERNHASIVLQRTMIGRAVQKQVTEIYNNYIGLTSEMRKTYAVLEHEQTIIDDMKRTRIEQYLQQKAEMKERLIREEILARFEGKTISDVLNVMGQAIGRHSQWYEIDKLVRKAKDERRRREAVEAGLRQKENNVKNIINAVVEKAKKNQNEVIEELLNKTFTEAEKESRVEQIQSASRDMIRKLLQRTCDQMKKDKEIEIISLDLMEEMLEKTHEQREIDKQIENTSLGITDELLKETCQQIEIDELLEETCKQIESDEQIQNNLTEECTDNPTDVQDVVQKN